MQGFPLKFLAFLPKEQQRRSCSQLSVTFDRTHQAVSEAIENELFLEVH